MKTLAKPVVQKMSLLTALKHAKVPEGKIVNIRTATGVTRTVKHVNGAAFLGEPTTGRIKGYIWTPASLTPAFVPEVEAA